MDHKPDGYPDLSPYLLVANPEATLAFAEAVFDGERLRVIADAEGGIAHAEIRIGDSVVMMGGVPDGPPAHLHFYLANPDKAFARALDAGAEAVQKMQDRDDGDRRGGVRDPCGTTWWLSRQT